MEDSRNLSVVLDRNTDTGPYSVLLFHPGSSYSLKLRSLRSQRRWYLLGTGENDGDAYFEDWIFDEAADLNRDTRWSPTALGLFPNTWRQSGLRNPSSFEKLLTGRYECAIHVDMLELLNRPPPVGETLLPPPYLSIASTSLLLACAEFHDSWLYVVYSGVGLY